MNNQSPIQGPRVMYHAATTFLFFLLAFFTLPHTIAQPCTAEGGIVATSSPTNNLCLNDGNFNPVQLSVAGNVGIGRFGLAQSATGNVVAVNTTGLFEMTNYPPGNYVAGHISVEQLSTISGITNINQLMGCYDLSNVISISSIVVNGGTITALGPTQISGGTVQFTVNGDIGPNKRWVVLNQAATQILAVQISGNINFTPFPNGTYRVVHAAFGPGINLNNIDPQNPQGCIDASNVLTVVKSSSSGPAEVLNPSTGRTWLDRNLGAGQVATSVSDAAAYGDLYQWGRGADGHQLRTSSTTTTLSNSNQPGNGSFILAPNDPFDWRSPQNDNLWQGVAGVNNPCPAGFRIPTDGEWQEERLSWSSNNSAGAFGSPLKLTEAGARDNGVGTIFGIGTNGYYWSSSVPDPGSARFLTFFAGNAILSGTVRATGASVRCIKDVEIIEGTVNQIACTNPTNFGTLMEGVALVGVSSSIPYFGGNGGVHNGQIVSSTGVGGLTATLEPGNFVNGDSALTYTITGTPTLFGVASFAINIGGKACTLTRFVSPSGSDCPSSVTFTYKGESVTYGTAVSADRCWLDRNLGAAQVATSRTDQASYGDLFQWGRGDDGHQNRTSPTTTTISDNAQPDHGNFILSSNPSNDWLSPQNDDLWQGVNGINNPCPAGFRIPTGDEWDEERLSWSSNNRDGAFNSPLKLPSAGYRSFTNGSLPAVGIVSYYWSSTVLTWNGLTLQILSSSAGVFGGRRASGYSVRCIKD